MPARARLAPPAAPGAAWRAYAVTAAFAAVAAAATVLTGGNYMFLRRKPVDGSLLDHLGPWPVYIAAGAAVGLLSFARAGRAGAKDPKPRVT